MKTVCLAIFDQVNYLSIDLPFPRYLNKFSHYDRDFKGALAYLYAYKDVKMTYNAYRREIERLLHWSWQVAKKSIFDLKHADIEKYIKFCQNPRPTWIGIIKYPRFIEKRGKRVPNPLWRPFIVTISKTDVRQGKNPEIKNYSLSEKTIQVIFAVLSSFYNFLIQEGYTEINSVMQIRQKSKYLQRQQTQPKIRRLSNLQWSFVIETAQKLAEKDKRHERTLFIMSALYSMYLRISELVVSDRWSPKMNDFYQDYENNWWFTTVGKGNKQRQIAVSNSMLKALKRWRHHLGLSLLLPTTDDQSPLIHKERGTGGITSTNQIRNIVQYCFDQAIEKMKEEGFKEEAIGLQTVTVHWLRHTGISDDVKHRPREHVRDDAGHSSSQTTDKYIDIDLRERHRSARNKAIYK